MKLINTKKVKDLLIKNNITQRTLSSYLGISPSGLSESLSKERPLSMNYIFDIASFFDVDAISLTIENDTKSNTIESNTQQKRKVS